MRSVGTWLVCALLAATAVAAEPATLVTLVPKQGALPALLQREVANANRMGKAPFVQLTAEWCGPCKALRASMGDPLMKDAFAGTYVILLDMDAWKKQLKPAGLDSDFVPVFFALDSGARPTGRSINGGAWGEDIPKNMAPPLKRFFRENGAGASKFVQPAVSSRN
jgi:thiol-disulfide isomerase/thioredoxin